jgi:hypothetical protein
MDALHCYLQHIANIAFTRAVMKRSIDNAMRPRLQKPREAVDRKSGCKIPTRRLAAIAK